MWFGRGILIINIETVRKGLFLVGDLQNWVGELQFAPTTESKTTDFQLNKYEKISIIFTPYIGIFASNRPESFAKEQREIRA